jgi:hypothetical protein
VKNLFRPPPPVAISFTWRFDEEEVASVAHAFDIPDPPSRADLRMFLRWVIRRALLEARNSFRTDHPSSEDATTERPLMTKKDFLLLPRSSPRRGVVRVGGGCNQSCAAGCRCFLLSEETVVIYREPNGGVRRPTPPYHAGCDCFVEPVD